MDTASLARLASGVHGTVTGPVDAAYDDARSVWNGAIDRSPAAVVACAGVDDVVEALLFARSHGLGVSVRSGGHHVAGLSVLDGGLVIDLGPMRRVSVDPVARTVHAEGGALIGDVDAATQQHALAVPLGVVSETGVAGLTLAGGYGWMRRKHGLSCDNVTGAEVVTADGRLVHAGPDEHPELFWALRGGGWDLGVVTALEYRAHPVGPDVYLPFLTFPLSEGEAVLGRLREFARSAPREFGCIAVCWTFPSAEPFPEELWGEDFVGVAGPYIGDPAEGELVCAELRNLGTVLTDLGSVVPWLDAQRFFDEDYPRGRRYHWKSAHLRDLDRDAAATLVEWAARRPSPLTSLDIWINGGAIADVPSDATPIADRTAPYMIGIESNWDDPTQDAPNVEWARSTAKALKPFGTGGSYLNFDDMSDPEVARRAHGENAERLEAVRELYDPSGLFRSRSVYR